VRTDIACGVIMLTARTNALLAISTAAGLLSLPTTWLTIRSTNIRITPQISGQILSPASDLSSLFKTAVDNTYMEVTGLNGHVTLWASFPIWIIIAIAITAGACQLADNFSGFDFPRPLLWTIACLAAFLVVLPPVIGLLSGRATLGIGWVLGAACALTPVVTLSMSHRVTLQDAGAVHR
jgi:hypothetical protein